MKDFNYYLNNIGEIGYVDEVINSVAYISGLPTASPGEVLLFESGGKGNVLSLDKDVLEVLLFSNEDLKVGTKVARTGEILTIEVGDHLLGKHLDGLGNEIEVDKSNTKELKTEKRAIDVPPPPIVDRVMLTKPLETGVSVVDIVVPIAKGQRELVIGDRNSGKSSFLHQVILNQARKGTICIYASIGKKRISVRRIHDQFKENGIIDRTIIVSTTASDPAGLVFITPYVAMTIAEYFRDKGLDVLIVLDDMSNHAKYYREISLLLKRFPGRNSYPGDIFYVHSKLIERAGSFKKGSITCLPVAESLQGDLSGYIQTNLMSMTDGHIFFDGELLNQGVFPPVNTFLSVTRVGLQAQTPLIKDTSRLLTTFLVSFEKLRQYMHFGAELTESVRKTLDFGTKIENFFSQPSNTLVPTELSVFILACIWTDLWKSITSKDWEKKIAELTKVYNENQNFRTKVNTYISSSNTLDILVGKIRADRDEIEKY